MRYAIKHCLVGAGPPLGRFALLFFLAVLRSSFAEEKSAEQLLAQIDRMRLPARAFTVDLTMTDYRQGKKEREDTFRLYSRRTPAGFDSLAVCLTPTADRNKLLLSRDERLWFYDPRSARAVPVAPSQFRAHSFVLDLFGHSLASTYMAELEGEGATTDLARREIDALKLKLSPGARGKGGGIIRYWLNKESDRPFKSDVLAGNNKILRTVYYGDFRNALGELRPMRLVVVNSLENSVHEVKFSGFTYHDTPDAVFEEAALPGAVVLLK
jgi:Outer membrane lipoprotein-sorting protein